MPATPSCLTVKPVLGSGGDMHETGLLWHLTVKLSVPSEFFRVAQSKSEHEWITYSFCSKYIPELGVHAKPNKGVKTVLLYFRSTSKMCILTHPEGEDDSVLGETRKWGHHPFQGQLEPVLLRSY